MHTPGRDKKNPQSGKLEHDGTPNARIEARQSADFYHPGAARGMTIEGVFSHPLQNGRQTLSAGIDDNQLQSRKVNNSISTRSSDKSE